MDGKITPELFFLNYAAPCSNNLVHLEKMTEEEHKQLHACMARGEFPPRRTIEHMFEAAFRRIKDVAKEMRIEDCWDMRVLQRYWHDEHNRYIDEGDGTYGKMPKSFCEFCKVHEAEIVDKKDRFFIVMYPHEDRKEVKTVVSDLLKQAKKGDRIRIHSGYAVEFA